LTLNAGMGDPLDALDAWIMEWSSELIAFRAADNTLRWKAGNRSENHETQ